MSPNPNYGYQNESELEESTNRVMMLGAGLLFVLALIFPLYRWLSRRTVKRLGHRIWLRSLSKARRPTGSTVHRATASMVRVALDQH